MNKDQRPAHISPELFRQWRAAIRGTQHPQSMTNPVWAWLVDSRLGAWQANELFGENTGRESARWCFERYGQSSTELPDGRIVWIGGEHEDHYDPDFFIYNDVTIVMPGGEVEIFGYPADVFPPTDFHSATLLVDRIVLIGSLGYGPERRAGVTQVLTLELDRWRVASIQTEGAGPGWIHEHEARLSADKRSIVISGGKVDRCDGSFLVENIDEWRLHLDTWTWERLTWQPWTRFDIQRQDNTALHLWQMRSALWSKRHDPKTAKAEEEKLAAELGAPINLELLPSLFQPALADEILPEREEEYKVFRIRVGNVIVRYVEEMFGVQVTVEGELPDAIIAQLRQDLVDKLEALEHAPMTCRMVPNA